MSRARTQDELRALIAAQSDAIRVCRVLCIVPIAYVHVSLGEDATLLGTSVRGVLRDLLGRSSVLLLSVISGLLMVRVFSSRTVRAAIVGRARGLLVPMVTWNLIALGAMALLRRPLPGDLLNAVFAVTDHGVTRPLTFLRDLFVVSLLTPALVAGLRRFGPWLLVPLVLAGGFVSTKPIVAHSQIVSYFALGVGFGVLRLEACGVTRALARLAPWLLGVLIVLSAARPIVGAPLGFMDANAFDALVRRPICAGSFWVISARLAQRERVRAVVVSWLEPAIFAMFLSHGLVLQLLRAGLLAAGLSDPRLALLAWVVLPAVALAVAVLGQRLVIRLPAPLQTVLLGKATRRAPAGAEPSGTSS